MTPPPWTRATAPNVPAGQRARRTLGVLLALAVVATAGAPAVITIRPGDTLWDLARKHGTTVAALQELNSLPGNGTIYAGDQLRITGGATGAPVAGNGERRHLVVTGDTLGGLAVRYGVSASSIAAANRLPDSTIQRGRRLTIPGAASGPNLAAVPTSNAGVRVPDSVRRSVAQHRATLAGRSHPSKAQVRQMVAATARRHGVDPSLAVAVAYHESGFQQRVVSGVDAIGVMQVLPKTGRVLGQQHGHTFDLLDAQDNISAGVLLLRQLTRSTGSDDAALAGYYQGLGSIQRRGVLPQTLDYQRNIAVLRQRFPNG
ncbi:MAG: LysM peptidoglycan-binding domain-containing protein [Actinobacteria bacterium]|nr:LysM peptidoglycan-binding domain-containing protein [Actinomycetota bacterium]MBW3648718.1 LysM peptidoglycan-binding domain-containing protein [Actinomycetota bacterium]